MILTLHSMPTLSVTQTFHNINNKLLRFDTQPQLTHIYVTHTRTHTQTETKNSLLSLMYCSSVLFKASVVVYSAYE